MSTPRKPGNKRAHRKTTDPDTQNAGSETVNPITTATMPEVLRLRANDRILIQDLRNACVEAQRQLAGIGINSPLATGWAEQPAINFLLRQRGAEVPEGWSYVADEACEWFIPIHSTALSAVQSAFLGRGFSLGMGALANYGMNYGSSMPQQGGTQPQPTRKSVHRETAAETTAAGSTR